MHPRLSGAVIVDRRKISTPIIIEVAGHYLHHFIDVITTVDTPPAVGSLICECRASREKDMDSSRTAAIVVEQRDFIPPIIIEVSGSIAAGIIARIGCTIVLSL